MNTTEHLQKIKAKCLELLEITEKRTPGKWQIVGNEIRGPFLAMIIAHGLSPRGDDAHFIASCAGAAEAGWRSTIAAIDGLKAHLDDYKDAEIKPNYYVEKAIVAILAAWPVEIL